MKRLFVAGLFILTMFSALQAEANGVRHELDYGWKFQRVSPDVCQWHPATVPGCVQTDLMAIGEIGDPYFRMNEITVQWVDKEDWRYRTVFDAPADVMDKDNVFICFDGLDVFADVTLNGEHIITADNMFRQWRTDIKELLKFHKEHGKIATLTAVMLDQSKGVLDIGPNNNVKSFREKSQMDSAPINAGYMVFEPEFFNYIADDTTVLEREPLEKVAKEGQLMSYMYKGYWQCMDTKREMDMLNELLEKQMGE